MPRTPRVAPGGHIFHVINRANGRLQLFKKEADFLAFEKALLDTHERFPLPILGWCIMKDHWHFIVRPKKDGDLARFFGRLALVHATRWQVAHKAVGIGHIYQGRFKSFMIQPNEHLAEVVRFIERNPVRSKLVKTAQEWRWSSLHVSRNGPAELKDLLTNWPTEKPKNWLALVNRPQAPEEEAAILNAIARSRPLGNPDWVAKMVQKYGLQSTLRPRGRQKGWRKIKDGRSAIKG